MCVRQHRISLRVCSAEWSLRNYRSSTTGPRGVRAIQLGPERWAGSKRQQGKVCTQVMTQTGAEHSGGGIRARLRSRKQRGWARVGSVRGRGRRESPRGRLAKPWWDCSHFTQCRFLLKRFVHALRVSSQILKVTSHSLYLLAYCTVSKRGSLNCFRF